MKKYGVQKCHLPCSGDVVRKVKVAPVTQKPRPQLYADDAEDEEDKEAENEHVAEHR